jgi:hypothetical protein
MRSLSQLQLFIDVDNDAMRVIDPNNNTVNASASLSQVTATPATYEFSAWHYSNTGAKPHFSVSVSQSAAETV